MMSGSITVSKPTLLSCCLVIVTKDSEVDVQAGVVVVGGNAEFVRGALAEPFHVLGQVRGDLREVERVDGAALGPQLADHVGDVQGVVEDRQVGQQGGELDVLLLLDRVVRRRP